MAPKTSVPSSPRLMRPERSVMVSPRLTKMNGVETRMAPPRMASGTPQRPMRCRSLPVPQPQIGIEELEAAVKRVGEEDDNEQDALQHKDGCVRQIHPPLQQSAGRID